MITVANTRARGDGMQEENLTIDQIAEMIHKAIDNTAVAEDEYPNLKERLHTALESERVRLRGK